MTLPASGAASYNLIAHDGKTGQWRTWANGVLPPIKTTPGQVVNGVTLILTRPAVVRGKIVDDKGRPVADRLVRSRPADQLENCDYIEPRMFTKADGTFEFKFVRPTEQLIQAGPLYGRDTDLPAYSKTVTLKEGQVVENFKLVVAEEPAP